MSKLNRSTLTLFAIVLMAVLGFGQSAMAQSDTVEVNAVLREAVTVTTQTDVSFGNVDVNLAGSGSLTLNPDGSFTTVGSDITSSGSGTVSAGQIDLTGSNGINIDVSCSGATVANSSAETIAVATNIANGAAASGTACAGVGSTSITVSLTSGTTSLFMGAALDIANMSGVSATGAFASTNTGGSASTVQAVYQ